VALLNAAQKLVNLKTANLEQKTGVDIVRNAVQIPVKQIAANGGLSGDVIAQKILEKKDPAYGYDARNDEFGNMFKKGIIDPTKVVKSSLINAASIASAMTSAEVMITDVPDEPKAAAAPPMPGPGMY